MRYDTSGPVLRMVIFFANWEINIGIRNNKIAFCVINILEMQKCARSAPFVIVR